MLLTRIVEVPLRTSDKLFENALLLLFTQTKSGWNPTPVIAFEAPLPLNVTALKYFPACVVLVDPTVGVGRFHVVRARNPAGAV